jgi:hypothetical protein
MLNGNPINWVTVKFRHLLKAKKRTDQEELEQTVEFTQDIPDDQSSISGFTQMVSGTMRVARSSSNHNSEFTQQLTAIQRTTAKSLTQTLENSQAVGGTASLAKTSITHTLELEDEGEAERQQKGGVSFGQEVSFSFQGARSGFDFVNLKQSLFAFLIRNGQKVGLNSAIETLTFNKTRKITFEAGIDTVIVTAPELGNNDSLDLNSFIRADRSNIRNVRSDLSRPEIFTLDFEINTCHLTEFTAFEEAHRGELITLTDYMGRVWEGIMVLAPKTFIKRAESINVVFVCKRIS